MKYGITPANHETRGWGVGGGGGMYDKAVVTYFNLPSGNLRLFIYGYTNTPDLKILISEL